MNLQETIQMYLPQPEVYAFIRKEGSQHCVKSHSGKNLGCFPSHGQAAKRLGQIEYFKKKKINAQDPTYYGPNTGGMGPSKALGSPE